MWFCHMQGACSSSLPVCGPSLPPHPTGPHPGARGGHGNVATPVILVVAGTDRLPPLMPAGPHPGARGGHGGVQGLCQHRAARVCGAGARQEPGRHAVQGALSNHMLQFLHCLEACVTQERAKNPAATQYRLRVVQPTGSREQCIQVAACCCCHAACHAGCARCPLLCAAAELAPLGGAFPLHSAPHSHQFCACPSGLLQQEDVACCFVPQPCDLFSVHRSPPASQGYSNKKMERLRQDIGPEDVDLVRAGMYCSSMESDVSF